MSTIMESYRALNGQSFRQSQLLHALRRIRLNHWLLDVDVDDMAKEALADGWITASPDGIFTFTVPDEPAVRSP